MRRIFAAVAPTVAAYAWRNRSQIMSWWRSRNDDTDRRTQAAAA